MKKSILVFACFVIAHFSFGQSAPDSYYGFVRIADSLYIGKNYKASASAYSSAFESFGWKGFENDRYNAARAWAKAGIPDSAFFNLDRIATKAAFGDYEKLTKDNDLASLHSDKRWEGLLKTVSANRKAHALFYLLDSMFTQDQKWRHLWNRFENKEMDSIPLDTIKKQWALTDSLDYFKVRDIFARYGYPNTDLVGEKGSNDFWLLVQHMDKHPQFQDSVLKAMKVEVDKGKAWSSDYAYLVDRVNINTGKPQVYGTQMRLNHDSTSYEPMPVIDPEKLDERHQGMHLSKIEVYISTMNEHNHGSLKKN